MTTPDIRNGVLQDVVILGLRVTVGVIFVVSGLLKFEPEVVALMESFGIPAAASVPVALGELVPGILLLAGVLTRMSSGLLSIYMLGAIFLIYEAKAFTGESGTELDIVLLAALMVLAMTGPGRISAAHTIGRLPRSIH